MPCNLFVSWMFFVVVESGFLQIDVLKQIDGFFRDHKVENSDTKFGLDSGL